MGGERARCPFPKNPAPDVGLRPRILALLASEMHPQNNFLSTLLGGGYVNVTVY